MLLSLDPPTPAEFVRLYAGTGWGSLDPHRAEQALAGSWLVCVAREDGRDGVLLGMARVVGDGALHAFVTEMIVREDVRGQGVGAQILEHLVRESRRRGVQDVQLFAARGRAGFYERNGFRRRPDDAPGMELAPDA